LDGVDGSRASRSALAATALAAAVLTGGSGGSALGAPSITLRPVDALERPIEQLVDGIRRDARVPLTRRSEELSRAAESHAATLARSGTFGHRVPGQRRFQQRLLRFYSARGFSYWATGENIFWARSHVSPMQVVRAWLNSLPHRLNLVDPTWHEVGVAAVRAPRAPGVYGGADVTIVVIEFGRRTR
jgi:uncharacterized protein YkwD